MFWCIVWANALCWFCLGMGCLRLWRDRDPAPEADLMRRAWNANRQVASEVARLGPLFRHIGRSSRQLFVVLNEAHACIRKGEGGVAADWLLLRVVRDPAQSQILHDMRHAVEQLEAVSMGLARYRVGLGELSDLKVPLGCIDHELRQLAA